MSETLPDDVLRVAADAMLKAGFPVRIGSDPHHVIARAILAERERCATIAQDDDGYFTWAGMDKNAKMLQQCAHEIAGAIRNRRQPPTGGEK